MKKFLCMTICLMLALTASAVSFKGVDYSPPVKTENVSIASALDVIATPMVDVQYCIVTNAPVVFVVEKGAPVTSKMASDVLMAAYIEMRSYRKRFQPPDNRGLESMRQNQLNMSRYHSKLKH
ncbi:MAG: hypothetical protein IKO85_05010 [Bacteroidaceae bacterium]|nr:hypothetical protein [Bacteroidaceae bacterium]